MTNQAQNLNWAQRFALIEAYHPAEQQVLSTFSISAEDYKAAQECLAEGQISVDTSFDTTTVGNIFNMNTQSIPKPVTATKPQKAPKVPKKRGRKGTKVAEAFEQIPSTPTPAVDFAERVSVSLAVLRQAKRFDTVQGKGEVKVKKIAMEGSMDKILMIWREAN